MQWNDEERCWQRNREDNEDFKNSIKCWICANHYVNNDVKVRDCCHITGKYSVSAHRELNIDLKLNHKISAAFHNLKNNHPYLIIQELGRINLKINVIPNGLGKYMSFTINDKLSFINGF